MVKKLYEIYTNGKCDYAIKLDGVGAVRSDATVDYKDYNLLVLRFNKEEDGINLSQELTDRTAGL